jgi:hypothetical protein
MTVYVATSQSYLFSAYLESHSQHFADGQNGTQLHIAGSPIYLLGKSGGEKQDTPYLGKAEEKRDILFKHTIHRKGIPGAFGRR